MTAVVINQRLTKVQNKLFEHAHSQALELKPLAIKFHKRGLQGDKLYLNPSLVALPLPVCDYLSSLSSRQVSLISAAAFANIYKYVAASEDRALTSNMYLAEKLFESYSDDYMIMHQETEEEFDHIWSFRAIHSGVCRELGVQSKFQRNGFFWGEIGATPRNPVVKRKYQLLQFVTGHGMKLMPARVVRSYGMGALWLLYRYLANVQLKQIESYLFAFPKHFNYDSLAMEISYAHATDEARHYTTSLDMGLDLYKAASLPGQNLVRQTMQMVVESHISGYFLNYWETLDCWIQGIKLPALEIGLESLKMALHHPEFADKQVDIEQLVKTWHQNRVGDEKEVTGPVRRRRWRYTAQQFERLINALDLELNTQALGKSYERYQEALTFTS